MSKTKQACGLVYYAGFKGYFAEFDLTKSGKKYKATSVKTFSSGIAGG